VWVALQVWDRFRREGRDRKGARARADVGFKDRMGEEEEGGGGQGKGRRLGRGARGAEEGRGFANWVSKMMPYCESCPIVTIIVGPR
jgi:hypothetical protein